jgi:glutathione S-transferase
LEEKQIPYTIEKINMRCYGEKPREFLSKVPSGLLPVLEINGTQRSVITESAVIQQVLEQMFPDTTPMLPPPNSIEAQKAGVYMRLERRLFSAWLQWLCYKGDNASNKAAFISVLQQVEDALGQSSPESPFFLDTFSLVDITFAPFLERIAASIYYYKGFVVRGEGMFPRLEAWFAAMERRPSYLGFKSDYYTHCHDLPPQLGGCIFIPEAAAATAAVDGTDGTSWHLPLPPLDATYAPEPHSVGEQPDVDRLAAAAKLVSNREKVVPFALRGPGKRDIMDARYAQLCDPNAKPRMEFERPVDAALRHVAHALLVERVEEKLQGDGKIDISSSAAAGGSGGGGGSGTMVVGDESGAQVEAVVASLSYMRDRVCVPRDLSLPAARQFRAHVNWVIDQLVL